MKKVLRKEMVQNNRMRTKSLMQNDMVHLSALKSTFNRIGIHPGYYSLNGYSEEAMCLERGNGYWLVYSGERGNKYNIRTYSNIYDACLNLILRLSESNEEQKKIENYFKMNLNIYKRIAARRHLVANRRRKGSKM